VTFDPISEERRRRAALLNEAGIPSSYEGPTWTTEEMQRDFEPQGFAAPYLVVRRRADGVRGTLTFTHRPRIYFDFTEVR
jgi:hypothetical protein